jgi:hypothetical protein
MKFCTKAQALIGAFHHAEPQPSKPMERGDEWWEANRSHSLRIAAHFTSATAAPRPSHLRPAADAGQHGGKRYDGGVMSHGSACVFGIRTPVIADDPAHAKQRAANRGCEPRVAGGVINLGGTGGGGRVTLTPLDKSSSNITTLSKCAHEPPRAESFGSW